MCGKPETEVFEGVEVQSEVSGWSTDIYVEMTTPENQRSEVAADRHYAWNYMSVDAVEKLRDHLTRVLSDRLVRRAEWAENMLTAKEDSVVRLLKELDQKTDRLISSRSGKREAMERVAELEKELAVLRDTVAVGV